LPTMKVRYLPARVSDPEAGARIDCKRFLLRYLSAFRAESLYPILYIRGRKQLPGEGAVTRGGRNSA
jgi:hypothetical protein